MYVPPDAYAPELPADPADPRLPVRVAGRRPPIGVMGKDGKVMPGWEASPLATPEGYQNPGAMLPGLLGGPGGVGATGPRPDGGLSSEDAQKVLAAMNEAVGMPHPGTQLRPTLGTFNPVTGALENQQANPEYQARLGVYNDRAQGALQAIQAAQGQQKLGTERAHQQSQAALGEYGLKVRGPEEDLAKLAGEEMRSRTQERVAEVNRRSAAEQTTLQALLAKLQSGKALTADDVRLSMGLSKGLQQEMRGPEDRLAEPGFLGEVQGRYGIGPGRRVGVKGPAVPVGVKGGPVEDKGDALDLVKSLVEQKAKAVDTDQFVNQALGRTLDAQGQPAGGAWNAERIAQSLGGFDPSLIADQQIDNLLAQGAKVSGRNRDEMMTDLAKAYMLLSRRAGRQEGAGDWKIKPSTGWWSQDVGLTNPAYGDIAGLEPGNLQALLLGGRKRAGTSDYTSAAYTEHGRAEALKHALAGQRLLNRFLSANYGGK